MSTTLTALTPISAITFCHILFQLKRCLCFETITIKVVISNVEGQRNFDALILKEICRKCEINVIFSWTYVFIYTCIMNVIF